MDYKFWILLLVCIVLFYMFHQIQDLKNEVNHLHSKTENIIEVEKYINKHKQNEINNQMKSAINNIISNKDEKVEEIKEVKKKYSSSEEDSTSSVISQTTTNKESLEEVYSNKNLSNTDKYNVDLDDVIDIIEQNHINKIDNEFKIKVVEESKDINDSIFIESIEENKLENNVNITNSKIELNNEENEKTEKTIIEEIKKNSNEEHDKKYNLLMNKNLTDLRKLAEENNIDIDKVVNGKKKKKLKKELCEELSVQ